MPGPPGEPQDRGNLCRDGARISDEVSPAVPERHIPGDGRRVVAAQVTEGLVQRMSLPAIEFDEDLPLAVPNVPVPMSAVGLVLGPVAESNRQPMAALHVASVPRLQRRCDAVVDVGQDVEQQPTPPQTAASVNALAKVRCRGQPSLGGAEHDIDGRCRAGGVRDVEQRLLRSQAGRLCRWMHRAVWTAVIQTTTSLHPKTRLVAYAPGLRDSNRDHVRQVRRHRPQPQGSSATDGRAGARVQHRRPCPADGVDRAGEGGVHARTHSPPPIGGKISLDLRCGQAELQ